LGIGNRKWKYQKLLSEAISAPGGMLCADGNDFAEKGKDSVGVYRQRGGRLGKTENCQAGVFAGYASEKGYGLLDSRLYLPEIWFSDCQTKLKRCRSLWP
jgi:SRSO17 transposase